VFTSPTVLVPDDVPLLNSEYDVVQAATVVPAKMSSSAVAFGSTMQSIAVPAGFWLPTNVQKLARLDPRKDRTGATVTPVRKTLFLIVA
jgi:hypothetical protein